MPVTCLRKRRPVKSGPPAAEMLRSWVICACTGGCEVVAPFVAILSKDSQHIKCFDLVICRGINNRLPPFPTKLHTMALNGHADRIAELKKQANGSQPDNPFYSPSGESAVDDSYKYNAYKVR